jgi:DEAD/DEAH box helicase domain-containing protein
VSQLDAIALSKAVQQRLVNFALDDHFVQDPQLRQACQHLWSGPPQHGGLLSDLWIEGAFPAQTAPVSLDDLVQRRQFDADLSNHLAQRGVIPRHRSLYLHQYASIVAAQQTYPEQARPALVVTAGTGAGKTESFLLPILNDLFKSPAQTNDGVKCIILYPMNALVNDQVDRLYQWLQGQQRLTLFHFTGETPENSKQANDNNIPTWDACRMRTRQEARGLETHAGKKIHIAENSRGPVPDILVTNYSMLEYMLCRPQDAVFFGKALKAIVLDEAHLYTGTLAAEITLLLRRLLERCKVPSEHILHIATSATIDKNVPGELETFAARLFTKREDLVQVIRGQPAHIPFPAQHPPEHPATFQEIARRTWSNQPTIELDELGKPGLAVNAQYCTNLAPDLALLVSQKTIQHSLSLAKNQVAAFLYYALRHAPLIQRLNEILSKQLRIALRDLSIVLWENAEEDAMRATLYLLQIGTSARPDETEYPLLPHRIHMLIRSTNGLTLCLNPACTGDPQLKLRDFGCIAEGQRDHCAYCQSAMVSLYYCENCGSWLIAGLYTITNATFLKPLPYQDDASRASYFTAEYHPGAKPVIIDITTGQCNAKSGHTQALYEIEHCPQCQTEREDWKPFTGSSPLILSILAESVLAELPSYPAAHNLWLPAQGRRMLVFSDSRQAAARLGPRLTRQHEIQLFRAALVQSMREQPISDPSVIQALKEEIQDLEQQLQQNSISPALQNRKKRKLEESQQELQEYLVGGSMGIWMDTLKKNELLEQLMDNDTAGTHEAEEWAQESDVHWQKNAQRIQEKIKQFLANEFARSTPRQISLETLGLAEITYPGLDQLSIPAQLSGTLPTAYARGQLAANWNNLLAALCDTLRSDGVMSLGSDEENRAYQFSHLIGRWSTEDKERGNRLISFVGATARHRRRRFLAQITQKCGIREDEHDEYAKSILSAVFQQLQEHAGKTLQWLEAKPQNAGGGRTTIAIRMKFLELGLRYPTSFYRSATTGRIWPREVLGCGPETGSADLQSIQEQDLDQDPRFLRQRRELAESPVFRMGLWAEEHSAQLAAKENRRLQDLFKAGIRNILSSTTTMELGIDIGGLNAVLMGNVPPGKANYLQRAGRAGRRADGSSIVTTFCHPRPFDREVFQHFGDYLARPLRSPKIFLDRSRIVRRHIHAFLLGNFFRDIYPPDTHVGAMNAFGNMKVFCGVSLPAYWKKTDPKPLVPPFHQQDWGEVTKAQWYNPGNHEPGLEGHFLNYLEWIQDWGEEQVRPALERLLRDTGARPLLDDWHAFFHSIIASFVEAISNWREECDLLLRTWHVIEDHIPNARSQANALLYQMRALSEITVIEALSDRQFMPSYGFPTGLQKLRVIVPDEDKPGRYREEDQYRLERSGLVALGEYVPGSQLLVGGKLITSHGLLKHWTGADIDNYIGLRGQYTRCKEKHFHYKIAGDIGLCPICGEEPEHPPRNFLLPMHGFSSAAWDAPKFSTDVERIGRTEQATITFMKRKDADLDEQTDFAGVIGLTALYRESGELLVYNEGEFGKGFAICLKCGYAESEKKRGAGAVNLPSTFIKHPPLNSVDDRYPCWHNNEGAPAFRNQTLAARQTTDALMLDFVQCLHAFGSNYAIISTLAQALLIGGAKLLGLDSRELGSLVVPAGPEGKGFGAVLYDNVPGGAGHVQELLSLGRSWLDAACEVMFVNEEHHKTCETACLDCLLTFGVQEAVRLGFLQRRFTLQILEALLKGEALPAGNGGLNIPMLLSNQSGRQQPESSSVPATMLTIEERRQRAAQKRQKKR